MNTVITELKKSHYHKLNHQLEYGGTVKLIDGRVKIENNAVQAESNVYWISDTLYDTDYIWHTHPNRGMNYEPPSGLDLMSMIQISLDLKRDMTGLILENKGVWTYAVNYRRLINNVKIMRDLDGFLNFLHWFGDMLAHSLAELDNIKLKSYYDKDDIKVNDIEIITLEQFIDKLNYAFNSLFTVEFVKFN